MTVFIDTGAFYALADDSDRNAGPARTYFRARLGQSDFVTSDAVLFESWTLIRNKLGWGAAARFLDGLRRSEVGLLFCSPQDLEAAARILDDYSDQELSLTDGLSFALMERHGVAHAFTFDKDFLLYRFGPGKRRSFTRWPG
ncbi:MAG: PIN domain-containing protein [Elusimicrobia bacterium]|nr:PIN domain-containing protein [Elusimicrobiota bacterium]